MQSEGAIAKILNRIANAINRFSNGVEAAKGRTLEGIALVFYCVGHMLMFLVHEPWFDEALAWLIARDSSIYEILFVTPHYEGHPSLWHLILVPFAKLGAPYELSLSIVSLLFSGLAMGLFIYKAPFKRIIRITIPFTYYLFYQYGVISRPYCMMMLAFVLMAISFKQRNEKPGRFVLSLWFLCISSAYGIVISGGICIAWLIEMLIEARKKAFDKNSDNGESRGTIRIFIEDGLLFKGKAVWLFGLLVYVIFIFWRIIPAENTYASVRSTKAIADNGIVIRLLYSVFASISDLFVTNVFYTSGTLENADIYIGEMISAVIIGAMILYCIGRYALRMGKKANKEKIYLLYFTIPYVLLTGFSAVVYLYYHHIGIILLFMGYWFWSVKDDVQETCQKPCIEGTGENTDKTLSPTMILIKNGITIFLVIMIIIPIYWNLSSCIMDAFRSYGSGRGEYEYLSGHGLDGEYVIFADWRRVFKDEEVPEEYARFDPLLSQPGVNIEPYLKNAVVINTPAFIGKNYTYQHEIPDKKETLKIVSDIAGLGAPDIILGKPEFEDLYMTGYVNYQDYVLVYKDIFGNVKKGYISDRETYIYVKKEIAHEKGLKNISDYGK